MQQTSTSMFPQHFGHAPPIAPIVGQCVYPAIPGLVWGGHAPRGWDYPAFPWGYSTGPITRPLTLAPAAAFAPAQQPPPMSSPQSCPALPASLAQDGPGQTLVSCSEPHTDAGSLVDGQFQDDLIDMYQGVANRKRLSKAEAVIALALRRIFPDARFEKVRPVWLTNPRTKRRLEIDIFCESLNLGFERNGLQHYLYPNGVHTSRAVFEALQERDKLKVELCSKRGVTLIHVPFTVPAKDTETFLRDELRRLNFSPSPALQQQ